MHINSRNINAQRTHQSEIKRRLKGDAYPPHMFCVCVYIYIYIFVQFLPGRTKLSGYRFFTVSVHTQANSSQQQAGHLYRPQLYKCPACMRRRRPPHPYLAIST